jgi:hypothetical protein
MTQSDEICSVHEHETIGLIFMMFQDALTSSME